MVRRGGRFGPLAAPLALFALALALRLIGVDWHGRHPDEDISGPARLLAGDLRMHGFFYPPLLTYLVGAADVVLFALGRLLGWWHGAGEFRAAYFAQPTSFFVTARIVVALCSAAAAPIAWLLARQIGLSARAALLTGLVAAALPGAVFWAHIAKSDSGIGPAFLLVLLAGLRLIARPEALRDQALLGFAVAAAVGFKHSAIFFIVPWLLILVLWSLRLPDRRGAYVRGWAAAAVAAVLFGAILNFGILLDLKPFLAAQAVQSQMSFRQASVGVTLATFLAALTGSESGLPWLSLAACAAAIVAGLARGAAPVRFLLATALIAWIVAAIVICSITGSRQPSHIWLPYLVVLGAAAGIGAGAAIDAPARAWQAAGYAALALILGGAALRVASALRQATAPSVASRVAAAIRQAAPPGARIATNIDLSADLPLSPDSMILERQRHERLARRYGIVLPPPDRAPTGVAGGYVTLSYPFAIGGLESTRPGELKVVLPYAWPLQPDEWSLDRWLADGFHLFVVSGTALLDDPTPEYRAFFRAVARCPRLATIPVDRPLFAQFDTTLYRCP